MDDRAIKIHELKEKYFVSDGSIQDKLKLKDIIRDTLRTQEYEEFEYELHIRKALIENEKHHIKSDIRATENTISTPVRRISIKKLISIAAVFAVVAIGLNSIYNNSSDDYNSGYLAMIEDYQSESLGKLSVRGAAISDSYIDSLKQGIDLSLQEDYTKSKELLRPLLGYGDRDELVNLHLGIDEFMIGNYQGAERNIKILLSSEDDSIREEAEMLLAQLYIKEAADDQAKSLLIKLSETHNHKYAIMAKEILKNKYQ